MEKLPDIKTNFAEWYQEVVYSAELVDQSPTAGCFVIRPYGYSLWENIQKILDEEIKKTGTVNAYFPLLIPESFFKKEKEHVEGFAPELAVVTHAGGKKLEEPLVVRPTSETIIYYMFAKWIKSWRDLPLKVNQWANVVRWEMRPRAFLRTREFLWQEGHTAHETKEGATQMAQDMLHIYKNFVENYLAIPAVAGIKTENEKFAGADRTFAIEGLMKDGKGLQLGTSHVLSHNFSKSFDILYQGKDGKMESPHCSSWGITTRLIGAIVMSHGDEKGLVFPPKIAPFAVVIVPIFRKEEEKAAVLEKVEQLTKSLKDKNIKFYVDADETKTPGSKFFHWEHKGVPLRVEIGPKDVANNNLVLVSRVMLEGENQKNIISFDNAAGSIESTLQKIQNQMFKNAKENLNSNWNQAEFLEEFGPKLEASNGLFQVGFCGNKECELKLKEFKATTRCRLAEKKHAKCFACKCESTGDVLVAKAY
ncbi:TPA: proline--tRNA ligase [Candidatus Dependentiae bacterium]|nr:MAG: Proline-tRNA ligase [candidate division TM6 bacterium GW2011_GWE2_31_21]KKP53598.1 MAG: Proline-tRNA ligase [candidate division TM6 bacterium GW2011_GWF2_33_332]HBS48162.1 proline--tRNA ligase [Candidatus Dependentiae bacterium]HBZ73586.1 proline--tRNA ligase [Candidatus Dependentiae bacterium]